MNLEENLPAFLTFLTALIAAFGGGIKWMISRIDRNDEKERESLNREREKLETSFNTQIAALSARVKAQEDDLQRVRIELSSYMRHVGVLEGLLKAHGIEVPRFEGTQA